MKTVKKVEIVVNSVQKEHLYELLRKYDINNFTLFEEVKGRGDRGWQDGEGLTNTFKNICLMLACQEDEFEKLKEPLRKLLRQVGGICLVSDANWLIH